MAEIQEAVTRTKPDGTEEVLYEPTEKGKLFHQAEEHFVLGEGGRNSGKSFALRWDAHLRCMMQPGFRALLLRRTFPQLRGSHFDKAEREGALLGCPKPFHKSEYYLTYSNGSKLQFGHCESDSAVMDYLSQEWDWIGFDELTTFTFDQFIRISASARSAVTSGRKAYVRAATNPVGIGASWVKRYFIDKNVSETENPGYDPRDYRSIKMNIGDNPHADLDAYTKILSSQPNESLRRAYRDGEWLVEGQFFAEFRENTLDGKPWHVIPELPLYKGIPLLQCEWLNIVRVVDWGFSEAEPGYCGWIAMLPDNSAILFKEWVFHGLTEEEVADGIKERSEGMHIRMTLCDPRMCAEVVGESTAEIFGRRGVPVIPADNKREQGWLRMHTWLMATTFIGTTEVPRLRFLGPQLGDNTLGAGYAIRSIPSLQVDPKCPSDTFQQTGVEDHAADAIRYWASNRPAPSRVPGPSLAHFAPHIRRAILGYTDSSDEDVLGSESVRR